MLLRSLIISLLLFLFPLSLFTQPQRETRAVWVSTNYRLDWPPKVNDSEVQKKELIKILDNIKKKNLNTVYFQVRSGGTVLYKSDLEPFAIHLVPQNNFDPLQFAIDESHKRGLEIHAWLNVVRLFAGSETSILRNPQHLKNKFPSWVKEFRENGSLSYWLDMGIPETREYLKNIFAELVQNYNVDGIHLDFIRYPGNNFDDAQSYLLYGNGINKDDWRRNNINSFISEMYHTVKKINPMIKVGAAPIGIYKNIGSLRGFEGYNDVYQDAKFWLQSGIIDYIVPQVYWNFGGSVPFEKISMDWINSKFGRQVIIGTAAYKSEVKPQLNKMIQFTRENNADGIAFFRYENIENISFSLFDEKAFPVEYTWIKTIEPQAPTNLSYNFIDNSIQLSWNKPSDIKSIFYYGLYSNKDLVELFPSDVSSVKFRSISNNFVMSFYLRSIDKAWNESKQTSNEINIENPFLQPFYNSAISDEFPVLLKLNNQFYLSLNSTQNDKINIVWGNSEKQNISSELKKGRNIITFPKAIESLGGISLKFLSSGKTISLNK